VDPGKKVLLKEPHVLMVESPYAHGKNAMLKPQNTNKPQGKPKGHAEA